MQYCIFVLLYIKAYYVFIYKKYIALQMHWIMKISWKRTLYEINDANIHASVHNTTLLNINIYRCYSCQCLVMGITMPKKYYIISQHLYIEIVSLHQACKMPFLWNYHQKFIGAFHNGIFWSDINLIENQKY